MIENLSLSAFLSISSKRAFSNCSSLGIGALATAATLDLESSSHRRLANANGSSEN